MRRARGKKPTSQIKPFFVIEKEAGFPLVTLPHSKFVLLNSEIAKLPKGFGGKLPNEQTLVRLTYGSKRGGVVRLYETREAKGLEPEDLIRRMLKAGGIYRDIQNRKGWIALGMAKSGVYLISTGEDVQAVKDASAVLAGK